MRKERLSRLTGQHLHNSVMGLAFFHQSRRVLEAVFQTQHKSIAVRPEGLTFPFVGR
jgi:hypothetical protein